MTTAARKIALLEALADDFGVVLSTAVRGVPYCVAQLRSLQCAEAKLTEAGAGIVALWADDEAATNDFVERNNIQFPIAYEVDASAVAMETGAFVNPDPAYLQ